MGIYQFFDKNGNAVSFEEVTNAVLCILKESIDNFFTSADDFHKAKNSSLNSNRLDDDLIDAVESTLFDGFESAINAMRKAARSFYENEDSIDATVDVMHAANGFAMKVEEFVFDISNLAAADAEFHADTKVFYDVAYKLYRAAKDLSKNIDEFVEVTIYETANETQTSVDELNKLVQEKYAKQDAKYGVWRMREMGK